MLPALPPLLKSLTNIFKGWLCCGYELLIHRLSSLGLITDGTSSVTIFHAGLPEGHVRYEVAPIIIDTKTVGIRTTAHEGPIIMTRRFSGRNHRILTACIFS
ncbi:MAG: hypothetical protein KJ936_08120, partial [Proteobacteria bacterium]|nr:hypothetical protein [Pseudomonadota bacterium]